MASEGSSTGDTKPNDTQTSLTKLGIQNWLKDRLNRGSASGRVLFERSDFYQISKIHELQTALRSDAWFYSQVLENIYEYMSDTGIKSVLREGESAQSSNEIALDNLVKDFVESKWPSKKADDIIFESNIGKRLALWWNDNIPETSKKFTSLDKIAKLINPARDKYIRQIYDDGKNTYNETQNALEDLKAENERFELSKKRMAVDMLQLITLYPEEQYPRLFHVILPAIFREYGMQDNEIKILLGKQQEDYKLEDSGQHQIDDGKGQEEGPQANTDGVERVEGATGDVASEGEKYLASTQKVEGVLQEPQLGGSDSDNKPNQGTALVDRIRDAKQKVSEAKSKWRTVKSGYDEAYNNIRSFYKWLLNTDETGYEAFKNTYSDAWLKKFLDFDVSSQQLMESIKTDLEFVIKNSDIFNETKVSGFLKALDKALDDNSDNENDINLISQYKKFVSKVSSIYNEAKAFMQKFETQAKQSPVKNEVRDTYGRVVKVTTENKQVNYQLPADLVLSFGDIVHEAQTNALDVARKNLAKASEAVSKSSDTENANKAKEARQIAQETVTKLEQSQNSTPKPLLHTMIKGRETLLDKVFTSVEKGLQNDSSPALSLVSNENLFAKILNEYLAKKNDEPKKEFTAREHMIESLHANRLIPSDVLKVNRMDKVVFVFLTLFIRLFCLSIIETMIEKGYIKTITAATFAFFGLYTILFAAFVALVNYDLYRLRIAFNMLNMHANGGHVYMHIGLLWLFGCFIYLVLSNLNVFGAGVNITVVNDYEKQVLISKLELLSLIVWALLTIVVVLT